MTLETQALETPCPALHEGTWADAQPPGTSLVDLEMDLENASIHRGIERARRDADELERRGELAQWTPHQSLIRGGLGMVAEVLKSALADSQGPHVTILRQVDPDLQAYAGLWCLINAVALEKDTRQTALLIARQIEDELWGQALLLSDPKQFAKVWRKVKRTHASQKARKKAMAPLAEKVELQWEKWPLPLALRVGTFVLNGVLRSGLATLRTVEGIAYPDLSADAHAALQDLTQEASWIRPINSPMVVAPKPWRAFDDGGYITRRMQEMNPLVRHTHHDQRRMVEEAIASGRMATCLEALNMIQGTPWRINHRMLDVVTWAYEHGVPIKGLPRKERLPLPKLPEGYKDLPVEEQRAFRREREKVRRRNTTIQGQGVTFRTDLATANRLAGVSRFWIPHNLDFRGRVYPMCNFSQQRGDYVRSMLEFADGVEVTPERGQDWLYIHCANAGDFEKISKKPLAERVEWTAGHIDHIRGCAREPEIATWWTQADKPFEFLRACMEIDDYVTALEAGLSFLSRLPVSIDGTNSGLQHYSAILRSEHDGRHVNLVPANTPADIYAEVARRVEAVARSETITPDVASQWLAHGITRSVVKRNVMTYPYSSTAFGFREQLMVDLMAPLTDEVIEGKREVHPFGEDGGWAAAGYLAGKVFAAVNETVSAASGAMQWLRKVAGALAHEGHGLTYVTPVGFPVLHRYTEYSTKVVDLWLYDRSIAVVDAGAKDVIKDEGVYRRIQSTLRVAPTKTVIKSRQKSAVAPNVIHSMDAAHLLLTTHTSAVEGVQAFSMVHDSFGCHASDMPVLYRVVREKMAEMYEAYCPLETIKRAADEVLTEKGKKKVPEMPAKGTLDLARLADCQFAFS